MKRLIFGLLIALGLAGAALAADFWEKKKFPDWSQKEVQKMLRDSPWARPVEIRLDSGGGRAGGGGRGGGRRGGGGMSAGMEGGGGEEGGMGGGAARGTEGPQSVPTVMAVIRWHTALPIKQAVVKAKFGDEAASSPEAAKQLSRQETRYVIGIAGVPMQAVRGNPAQMKPTALLRIKGKDPIQTADVKVSRDGAGVDFFLFFPKEGARVITLEDNEVELVFKAGALEIKRKFKLKDMLFDGKLEI